MPTYEYECDKCKKHFDIFQSMVDDPIKKCPECDGKFHRLIGGGSGIIFKGTGFYETDYKKKSHSHSDACKHCPSNKGKNNKDKPCHQ